MTAVASESHEWPSVLGVVMRSDLEARQRKRPGQPHMTQHYVRVTYEYIIDEARYENDVVRFDQASLTRTQKERLVSAHPVGRPVEVFYNPTKPGQSVLVPGSY